MLRAFFHAKHKMRKGLFLTGGNHIQLIPAKKRVDANPNEMSLGTKLVLNKNLLMKAFSMLAIAP